jgi:type III secretion YscU/HrpY family protein
MSGDKTEQPTPKRLREARKKGQVAQSKDLASGAVFVAGFLMGSMTLPAFADKMRQFMAYCFTQASQLRDVGDVNAFDVLSKGGSLLLEICAPIFGTMFILALFVSYIQVGALFTVEPLKPDLKKFNPVEGFKKIFFKPTTYIELAKSVLKMTVVFVLVYMVISQHFRYIVLTAQHPLNETAQLVGALMFKLFLYVAIFFLVVAAADFFIQKKMFMKNMKMSKEEVKQEHKQQEGDPHTKHQRKRLFREITQHNTIQDVKKATVVVVNPEHIAVAIEYNKDTMNAPRVAAKGLNLWAHQIIEIAKQYGIPIMRNVPLAHSLHELEIGDEVPENLYEAVAEVLNWVYQMSKKD